MKINTSVNQKFLNILVMRHNSAALNAFVRVMKVTNHTGQWLVGWILWHINPCWLFNAKSCLNIYIKYMIYKHIVCS